MQSKCGDKNTGGSTAEELGMPSHERDHNNKRRREEQDDADLLLSMTRRSRRVAHRVSQQTRFVDNSQTPPFPLERPHSFDDDSDQVTVSTSIAAAAAAAAAVSGIGTTSDIRLHAPSVYTDALESLQRLMGLSRSQNNLTLPSPHHYLSYQHVLPLMDTRPPLDYSLLSISPIIAALHHSALAAPRPFLAGVDPRCIMPLSSPLNYNLANRLLFEDMQVATRLPDSHTHQLQQAAAQRFLLTQGTKSEQKRIGESNDSLQLAAAAATSMQRNPVSSSPALPSTKTRHKRSKTINSPSITGSLLYDVSSDHDKLNDHQIYLRMQIEYFQATQDDILSLTRGKNKPIVLQQVGIRCRHCCHVPVGRRKKGSAYFPSALMGIYQAAQNLGVEHLQSGMCPELPQSITNQFATFKSRRRPGAPGGGKKYWADSGAKLGLIDTEDGIRFAGDVADR